MPINKPPAKLSDVSGLQEQVLPTDQFGGFRLPAAPGAKGNVRWTAQTVADWLKTQVSAGARAATLTAIQAALNATPPDVSPGSLYAITGTQIDDTNPKLGTWNSAGTVATVYVQALSTSAFDVSGVLLQADGTRVAVDVNVAAGTYAVAASAAPQIYKGSYYDVLLPIFIVNGQIQTSASYTWAVGDVVTAPSAQGQGSNSSLYQCTTSYADTDPYNLHDPGSSTQYWTCLINGDVMTELPESGPFQIFAGQLYNYQGSIYRSNADGTYQNFAQVRNSNYLKRMAGIQYRGVLQATATQFLVGDVVYRAENNTQYICVQSGQVSYSLTSGFLSGQNFLTPYYGFIGSDYFNANKGSSSGPAPPSFDIFAVGDNQVVRSAVSNPGNTWDNGDLIAFATDALREAGAPPAVPGQAASILVGSASDVHSGGQFDVAVEGQAGDGKWAWRYQYGRRNDGTSGWTRILKGGTDGFINPYNVPTAKAMQVIASYKTNGGPFDETEERWFGCKFIDDYAEPGDEFKYECEQGRVGPSTPAGADPRQWKWRRYLEAGV